MKRKDTDIIISIVMAAYNAEGTIGETLGTILGKQTYKNLEIIVVDDGSSDNTSTVVAQYQKEHPDIRLVTLDENVGPFRARVIGADAAKGDYLHFIDADDYLSDDFYRSTLKKSLECNADIVIGSIVLDFKNTGEIKDFPLINDLPFNQLKGSDIFKSFMIQSGFNFTYHMNSTKLYSMKLWRKARPHYDKITDHLIMADDVAMNVPLWYYAKKLERVPTATLFYVKDENDSATSNYNISFEKMMKNISDLCQVFQFFEGFLKEKELEKKFGSYLTNWKKGFVRIYESNISQTKLSLEEQSRLKEELYTIAPFNRYEKWLDTPLFTIVAPWKNELQDIKFKISSEETRLVIFHFNTLFLKRSLPSGETDYTLRQTGLELYELATHLGKEVRFQDFPEEINLTDFTGTIDSHKEATVSDFTSGSTIVTLPLPIDIFTERHLHSYLGLKYDKSAYSTTRTIIETLANLYFDNPYSTSVEGSIFNGRPTLLGCVLGIHELIQQKNLLDPGFAKLVTLLNKKTSSFSSPYDDFFVEAAKNGSGMFTKSIIDITKSLDPSSAINDLITATTVVAHSQAYADRQILRLLTHYEEPAGNHALRESLIGKSRITKVLVYSLADRGALIASLKDFSDRHTSRIPHLNKGLKKSYRNLRSLKRKFVK